jgi:hypothetical protein
MGQLESLRELSITQPTHKKKKKKKKKKKIKKKNNILPWLFQLIGIPMIFEVLILRLK